MKNLGRKIVITITGIAIALCAFFTATAGAQAASVPPISSSQIGSQVSSKANPVSTVNIYNLMKRPLEVTIFPDGGQVIRKNLNPDEHWKLSAAYGQMNEISVRFPDDPNYAFHGYFDQAKGQFRITQVLHSSINYHVQATGPSAGIAFYQIGGIL